MVAVVGFSGGVGVLGAVFVFWQGLFRLRVTALFDICCSSRQSATVYTGEVISYCWYCGL